MMFRQRILVTALATLLGMTTSHVLAQQWAQKMFKEHSHSFGNVAVGSEVEYRFEFQNLYEEDIHIAGVTSSCGCTTPSVTQDTLKTWDKAAVVAKFNTRTFRGPRRAMLTVKIDRPFPAEVQLHVDGNIRADMVFEPGTIQFGDVEQNTPARRIVRVIHSGSSQWAIRDVRSTYKHIRVGLRETYRAGGVVNYDMIVELTGEAPPGYVQGELFVETNEPNSRFPLTFGGRVVSLLQVSPEIVAFSPSTDGHVDEQPQKILLKADQPFRITGIESDNPDIQAKAVDETSQRLQVVEVRCSKPDMAQCENVLRIKTDLGNNYVATVKVVVGAPGDAGR
jgi:hypothetical protein